MKDQLLKPKPWMKWLLISLGWTALALVFTGQNYVSQAAWSNTIYWKRPLIVELVWAHSWNLVTPFILQLLTRFPLKGEKLSRAIGIHALAAPLFFIASSAISVTANRLIV